MNKIKNTILVAAGICAGITAKTIVTSTDTVPSAAATAVSAQLSANEAPIDTDGRANDTRRTDQRIEALEALVHKLSNEEAARSASKTPLEEVRVQSPPDAVEYERQLRQEFQDAHDRFRDEPVDSTWSKIQQAAIDAKIQERLQNKRISATATTVECKSTMCLARFTWPDLETAKKDMLAADIPDEACSRTVLFPERLGDGALTTDMIFECSRNLTER